VTHPFDAYNAKHRRQPTVRLDNGVQRLTVTFHRGYVHIKTSSPFAGEVYITRSTFLALLRKVVPIARVWVKHPRPDWDVPKAVHEAYLFEQSLDRQKRELKKKTGDQRAAERKHKRFLAAKARSKRT
jgi:hypothetical protein